MVNKYHLELTGEKLADSKRRLRAVKREKVQEEVLAKAQEKVDQMEKESETGFEFATVESFGFKEGESFFFVDTIEKFEQVAPKFDDAKVVSIDFIYGGALVSTITLASDSVVAVFDMLTLSTKDDVKDWVQAKMNDENLDKVTHSFVHDVEKFQKLIKTEPEDLKGFLELSDIIKDEKEEERKLSLIWMAEHYLKKSFNKAWNRFDWIFRPMHPGQINYAATLAVVQLKVFLKFSEESKGKHRYFEYQIPSPKQSTKRRKGGKRKRSEKK